MAYTSIGVISDTHGNNFLMENVCSYLLHKEKVHTIYHLGDNYEDGEYLISVGYPVRIVPGLWCNQFEDGKTPKVIIEEIHNTKIAFAHTIDLILKSRGKECHIYCFGHTHIPIIKKDNNKVWFNPGHLKKQIDRGNEASFGIIKFETNHIYFEIISAWDIGNVVKKIKTEYLNLQEET
ncbi:MAG TPA: metallophosphoesterase family protein [Candidatus Hydrogenedens sp.]|nr:metallophosphoesterase family protein [Candidatus Hydrogenedens sp.]